MGKDAIRLGREQERRVRVLNLVLEGALTIEQAAERLALSERQVQRLQAAYQREGPRALVHGNQGRVPWHALPAEVRARVVALARGTYAGLNDQHLTEKLAEVEGLVLGRTTVRRILREAGLASPPAAAGSPAPRPAGADAPGRAAAAS